MTKTSKQLTGNLGEGIARKFLEKKGFLVLETNFRRKWGEIDIIAERGGIVRFVEVKSQTIRYDGSREMSDYSPEEMAHEAKIKKVARTASLYMEQKSDHREYQIDVVAVVLDEERKIATCRFYEQVL